MVLDLDEIWRGTCALYVLSARENELNRRGSRFGGNSKVYKCSLSRKSSVTLMSGVGFG